MRRFTLTLLVLSITTYTGIVSGQLGGGGVTYQMGNCTGQEVLVSVPEGDLDVGCAASGSLGEAAGSMSLDHGILKASSSFSLSGYSLTTGQGEAFTVYSNTVWADVFTVNSDGIEPAYLELGMHLSGASGLALSGANGTCSMASYGTTIGNPYFASIWYYDWANGTDVVATGVRHPFDVLVSSPACLGYWGSDRLYHASNSFENQYDQVITAMVPLYFGYASVTWYLGAFLSVSTTGNLASFNAGLWSDFSSTMGLTSYRVLDAAFNDITNRSIVDFGATKFLTSPEPPSTAVPEPASMTLLATGLAGMAAARRRQRKQ